MHVHQPTGPYLEFPSPPYPLSVKHASIENLLNISYWLWRLNPLSMFPVILSNAFEVLKQSIIVIAIILGLSQLTSTGILKDLAESISKFDFERMVSLIYPIIHMLVPILIATISIYYIASILVSGFLNSAEYGSYLRLVKQGTISFKDVFEETRIRWFKMSCTDFIVETTKGMFLVETKGLETEDVPLKDKRAIEWCKDVSNLTKRKWTYLKVKQDVFNLNSNLESFERFAKLLSVYNKTQEN
ncbi:MAG: hypothetical protein OH338_00620 [Candidatus Parvarchaeota archaeon]|nr:hypothetical protein [Candidatus Parvarchaeum tengchongense]